MTTSMRRLALGVVASATLMTILDGSIVTVAMPAIQADLGFSDAGLSWVINAYLVAFGSLLLLSGRLGDLVGRSRMAIRELSTCGADLFLAGHLHISHTGHTAKRYKFAGRAALVVQAGTATSTRARGEGNSFNVIRLSGSELTIDRMEWRLAQATFTASVTDRFRRVSAGWTRL